MGIPLLLQLRSLFPYKLRSLLTFIFYTSQDVLDALLKRRIQGVPPRRLMVGGARTADDFLKIGNEFFSYLKVQCQLRPDECVLDVGCGVGQKMFPLLTYLGDNGAYEGFDLDAKRIAWLTKNVTSKYPQFKFQVCDIFNSHYNPSGLYKPSEYRFPYEDNSFDFVLCASVFTHMLTDDVAQYLAEIRRVMRSGGRCLISFFILTETSRALMQEGKSSLDFVYNLDRCLTTDSRLPEAAIAFHEDILLELFRASGLLIRKPIFYGNWCEKKQSLSYQDLIIADKE